MFASQLQIQREAEPEYVRLEQESKEIMVSPMGLDSPDINEEKMNLRLVDVVTKAKFHSRDQDAILADFNRNVEESAVSFSSIRGRRIQRDEYLLVHRNKIPQLVPFNSQRIALPLITGPGTIVEEIKVVKQTQLFYGAHGSYVLNVPVGKFAKAWSAKHGSMILDSGTHVVHDPNFIFDPSSGFVDKAASYIQHYNLHILRVPAGKVAKVWIGSESLLLESQVDPYVFNTSYFELVKTTKGDLFEDASSKLIQHGSLKRLIPYTSEVAVTYNNGKLAIIKEPTLIKSATHLVQGFLTTSIQTVVFPSEDTKHQRQKEGAIADEIAYQVFTTKDSLKVGVKLMVAYAITNPEITIAKLGRLEDIINHIENVATVDMGMVIQKSSAQEFLSSVQTKPRSIVIEEKHPGPSAPEIQTIKDEVQNKLTQDLAEYGIELVRLNFETPKILNTEIAQKMSKQSLISAEVSAKEANMEKNIWIATSLAQQDSQVLAIKQKQANANITSEALARAEATKIEAEAKFEATRRQAESRLVLAEAEQKAAQLQGEVFKQCPALLELEKAKLFATALQKAQLFVVNNELRELFQASGGLVSSGLSLFAPRAVAIPHSALPREEAHSAPPAGIGS